MTAGLTGALARGRAAALARMTSRCAIMRKTGATTTVSGLEVPEWATVDADSPVRVAGTSENAAPSRDLGVNGIEGQVARRELHLPYDIADLADGDLVEITSGDCAGLVFRVVEADWQDQATARRVPVDATQRPGEWA